MSKSEQKVVQYLGEAHASEVGLVSVLRSQIAMTPRGSYRDGLEQHLGETHRARASRPEALGRAWAGPQPSAGVCRVRGDADQPEPRSE